MPEVRRTLDGLLLRQKGAGGSPRRTMPQPPEHPLARVDFLDLIAHELRQPLTAARGSLLTILDRRNDPGLDEKTVEVLLEVALRNMDQLAALLHSLRVFSQADQGSLEVVVEPVSVERLFEDCAQDFPDSRTNRRLETTCSPGLHVRVDRTLFKQVITNLVANAVKFSPPGSVITLSAVAQGEETLITVENDGIGFPAQDRERIFEKSVRLDSGASGLGMGLYVARAIVNAHNGHLTGKSEQGRGAKFHVAVPA